MDSVENKEMDLRYTFSVWFVICCVDILCILLCVFSAGLITSDARQLISLCQRCVERIEKLSHLLIPVQHHIGDRVL